MSGPRYLVRFDDICPRMNWQIWEQVEGLLQANGIRPLLAVVPDNRDPALEAGDECVAFWDRVRSWQSRGWAIGLHGYQHVYCTSSPGLIGLNARSEFAGLPESEQAMKLDAAISVFRREQVKVDCWIAPGHSFDAVTVKLLHARGITVISDGFFRRPVRWLGCTWVPQQLWKFRPMPEGTWSVCFHHNGFRPDDLSRLGSDLVHYRDGITDLARVLSDGEVPPRSLGDSLFSALWLMALRLRRAVGSAG